MINIAWPRDMLFDQLSCLAYVYSLRGNTCWLKSDYTNPRIPFYKTRSILPEYIKIPLKEYSDDIPFIDEIRNFNQTTYKEVEDFERKLYFNMLTDTYSLYFAESHIEPKDKKYDGTILLRLKQFAKACKFNKDELYKNYEQFEEETHISEKSLFILPLKSHFVTDIQEFYDYLEFAMNITDKDLYVYSNNANYKFEKMDLFSLFEGNKVVFNLNKDEKDWKWCSSEKEHIQNQKDYIQLYYNLSHCKELLYPSLGVGSNTKINLLRNCVLFFKYLEES